MTERAAEVGILLVAGSATDAGLCLRAPRKADPAGGLVRVRDGAAAQLGRRRLSLDRPPAVGKAP